ncbi:thymidine kinase [Dysgonomonas sp. HDW5A]|uniref:thymidine kinase n=1 Tax=Dysgonomonas sp. HDW5A TaxID=2714926 RepID=UPI00140DE3A0|nr:thymidine kinase [Dysgonomonas sp. HDW5A]QIK61318.1 thymidine kinase [Dysgonomonas sp. HDW5A]
MIYCENTIHETNNRGSIEVICGSMFSGKTEELLRRLKRAKIAKQEIEIFKPAIDTRYSDVEITSHDKNSIQSTVVEHSSNILLLSSNIEVVGIDEAQFFDMGLVEVCQQLADQGIRVIIAGLDMDFKRNPFGPIPNLCAIADDVEKVHAICVECGKLANYSYRLVSNNDKQVMLGELQEYKPLCRSCYTRFKDKK